MPNNRFSSVDSWCVQLLAEWGASDIARLGLRASPCWGDEDDDVEGDEMRALRAAVERLRVEEPTEYELIVAEFKSRRMVSRPRTAGKATDRATLNVAINRVARWVDAAMGEA